MKKRYALLLAALLVTTSVLSACATKSASDDSLSRVKTAGKLTVAIDATYPPMEFVGDDGKTPVGFDVELVQAIAKKLGVTAEFSVVDWDGILTGLTGKRYDAIFSSMNITPEREQQVSFVEYVKMSQVFVSKKGGNVKTEKDLAGKTVIVQAETTSQTWVEKIKQDTVKDIKEIRSFKGATDAFLEVKNGRGDVIVIDEPVGLYYAKLDAATFEVTGRALAPEPVGAAFRKEDVSLREAVAKALTDLQADGTIKTLSNKWFGKELGK
jgi:polar amino acid transport system substrate-binding protein